MASEHQHPKEETPLLSRIPPRISVPGNSRARLSHRKPILLASGRPSCPVPSSSSALHSISLPVISSAPAQVHSTLSSPSASPAVFPDCPVVGNTPFGFSDTISTAAENTGSILKKDCSLQNRKSNGTSQLSHGTCENGLERQMDLPQSVGEAGGPDSRKPSDDGSSTGEKLSSSSELMDVEWGENYQGRNEIDIIKRESSSVLGVDSSVPHQLRNEIHLAKIREPEKGHLAIEAINVKNAEEPECLQRSFSKPAKQEPFADEKLSSPRSAPDLLDSGGRPAEECRSEDGQGLIACGSGPQDVTEEQCPPFSTSLEKKYVVDDREKASPPSGLPPDECELEEGQLSGEWSGSEGESEDNPEPSPGSENIDSLSGVFEGDFIGPPCIGAMRNEFHSPFQAIEHPTENRQKAERKRKKKHKKGEGSKKRSREKSKEKYKEVLKKRTAAKGIHTSSKGQAVRDDGCHGGTSDCGGQSQKITNQVDKLEKLSDNVLQIHSNELKADNRLEDGEIPLEVKVNTKGLLSSLVEAEVGLWTTDDVDDQLVAELAADGAAKKKRGPDTAERKLKRKIAKRKKRAQKERALGRRRPPINVQSKPVKVLCTHYMKGRCAKGDQCTFSHDAVPLTKQEPCKFLMSHSCLKGDDCPYSHDLRSFPCKFFHTRGLCFDGENCQFSHEPISDEELEKLRQRVEKEKKDRQTGASVSDIPAPTFSTPLPPDLDPDPLGWGNSTSYSTVEGLQNWNPDPINSSTPQNGTVNFVSYSRASPLGRQVSTQWLDMQSSKIEREVTALDDLSGPSRAEVERTCGAESADCSALTLRSLETMECESFVSLRFGSEAFPQGSSSPGIGIVNSAVSQPPPNEGSSASASAVLEVSKMEGGNFVQQIVQEKCLMKGSSNLLNTGGPLRPRGSIMMPPFLERASTRSAESGRQSGSRVLDTEKILESVTQSTTIQQRTVDSLLDEALRHI